MTDTDSAYGQTMRFNSESDFGQYNNDDKPNPKSAFEVFESSIDKLEQVRPTDGTETGSDRLWANKNYQFETKDPSFYQNTAPNERHISNKIVAAIYNNDKCPVCVKVVYAQEQVKALNKVFHKSCFRCRSCKNMLQTNRLAEHGNDMFCQNCYDKKFGSRKYGSIEKTESQESEDTFDHNQSPVNYRSVLLNTRNKSMSEIQVPSSLMPTKTPENPRRKSVFVQEASSDFKSVKSLLKPVATKKDKCSTCTKPVFANEEVKWNSKVFHKICFRCNGCNKKMMTSDVVEFEKSMLCGNCHAKRRQYTATKKEIITESVQEVAAPVYESVNFRIAQTDFPLILPIKVTKTQPQILTHSSKTPVKKIEIKSEHCDVCKKIVYKVEQMKLFNVIIHKSCFRCNNCNKILEEGKLATQGDNFYCHTCFRKHHSTKGFDFATGSFDLENKEASKAIFSANPAQLLTEDFSKVRLRGVSERSEPVNIINNKTSAWSKGNDNNKNTSQVVRSTYQEPDYEYIAHMNSPSKINKQRMNAFNVQAQAPGKVTPSKYGNSLEKCAKCHSAVYAVELVKALNKSFHKACLKCKSCKKILEANSLSEHNGEIYCKSCYAKNYGPKRYGHGAFTLRPESPPYERLNSETHQQQQRFKSPVPFATSANASFTSEKSQRFKSPVPFAASANSSFNFDGENFSKKSMGRTLGGGAAQCTRCQQVVYDLEKVVALKKAFHKSCYTCFKCRVTLSPKTCCENSNGEILCKCCYSEGNGLQRVL